jgi:predicted aspartyl protease
LSKATIIAVLFLAGTAMASQASPTFKQLYDQHRWFDLREAIKGRKAPPLYKGAVASAFNHTKAAEKYLKRAIKLKPNSADAEEAHERLVDLYSRLGKYHDALRQLDAALTIKPANPDLTNERALLAAWGKHPDQSLRKARSARIHADVRKNGVTLPLSIHGKTVHWALDTGANISIMSEAEARMLGVAVDDSSASVDDSAGGKAKVRTAVVDELALGGVRLRNVAFLVLPDSQEPMRDQPPGERGLIGLPVALALRSIGWSSDGTFEIQPRSLKAGSDDGNLAFDGLTPVTRVRFEGRELDCIVDSGNGAGTQLWTRFANDFADLLKQRGKKSRKRVTMVGGSNQRETVELPEIELRVGGLNATLRSAQVFSKPVGDDFHHGLLGMDVLSQAREVRIDFTSMTMQLLP